MITQLPTADAIAAAIGGPVAAGELAGAAALVWRRGQSTRAATVGRRDLRSGAPVERDTIFRIASLTKPVTTLAALLLFDEGRFALGDPITTCAPELAQLRVLRDPEGPLDDTTQAERPITFGDLLTHRAGLTYAEMQRGLGCFCGSPGHPRQPRSPSGLAPSPSRHFSARKLNSGWFRQQGAAGDHPPTAPRLPHHAAFGV